MKTSGNIILSIVIWVVIGITLPMFFIPASLVWIVCLPFDPRQVVFHYVTCLWTAFYLVLIPGWSVRVYGREKIKRGKVYIILSNHQSLVDIAALYFLFRHFKWISKKENFRIPVIGWVMWMNRYVSVDRDSRTSIIQMMEESEHTLKKGNSLLIFPEGTRSRDGKLGNFKDGAFLLSKRTGVPVIPVVLHFPGNLLGEGFIFQGNNRLSMYVLDEVSPDSFPDVDSFRNAIRQVYLTETNK
jgi:1-acyl-sn-glycerol-3-phosphate acyltransferase